jgi:hypothetical protein
MIVDYNMEPVDDRVIETIGIFLTNVPEDIIGEPKIVPMTRGRLQFEWHRGNRTLEFEFEKGETIHYLKWDSDEGIEEEEVVSVYQTDKIESLLRWFSSR